MVKAFLEAFAEKKRQSDEQPEKGSGRAANVVQSSAGRGRAHRLRFLAEFSVKEGEGSDVRAIEAKDAQFADADAD